MNINFLAFVDAAKLCATYAAKWQKETQEVDTGLRVLDLDVLTLAQWKTAESFLSRLDQILRTFPPLADTQTAQAQIVDMDPGAIIPWQRSDAPALFMCMNRSPGLRLMCGLEVVAPIPGDVLLVNRQAVYSVINQCEFPAVFLYAPLDYRPAGAA